MDKVVRNHIRGFTGHEHYADLNIINMKAPSKREQKQACLIFVEREVLRDEVPTYGRLRGAGFYVKRISTRGCL